MGGGLFSDLEFCCDHRWQLVQPPKCHFREQSHVFFIKMFFYLHAKARETKSGPKEKFLLETSSFPRGRQGRPSLGAVCSPLLLGLCLRMGKLPIPVAHKELSLEQYSILQSSTSCIYPELFMHGILKLFMTPFKKGGGRKKEFKRGNLLKTQTPTELNEPLRVNRT